MTFSVIDKRTGKAPIFDHNHIFKEKWFKNSGLIYCDIDGWYIGEDGELVLIDDCGNAGYPPIDRFEVVFDEEPKQGEWIPCSERLPKPDKYVLVCSDEGNIEVAEGFISTEIEEFVWLTSGWRFGTVIAWMPLPEPYKKEGDEK